ncbi:uncharacterized protein Pyn_01297 [Prunus yedoensis var. nudiflora]|uniref:Peptidase C19 ubiquitin carboxyl-terminal hydrolase domain-containing protein n=1 Tax=Prunus yedoensis var. nudiflora TaxID=2094558 RepID=A0A314YBD2_PRUYE|nr:uncharacterized protein Pyn_01297 [Prunus yedoensis var. nudiflora]
MCAKRVILSLSNQFPSLELHNREQNGRVDDLSASKVKGELHKCLNGPVTVATVLLPRGLINSGNLCFLNSTLQALLSCSPFVQLLQELRTRKVPKSSSLNLTCLVVQVQRTKMQVFLRLVGLLALPCLKAFFKFLLQMYELGSWAGQGVYLIWVTSISLRREGADIHVDVGLCITQEQQISEVLILASNPIGSVYIAGIYL